MKLWFIVAFFQVSQVFGSCRNDVVSITRETGLSIGSGGVHSSRTQQTVNMPVQVDGVWGCWSQRGGLSFEVERERRKMDVILPRASFRGIDGRLTSYAILTKTPTTLRLDLATFVCVGESVIAAESFSGTAEQARAIEELSVSASTIIVMGPAARELARQREEQARRLGKITELPGKLEDFFISRFEGELSQLEEAQVRTPAVYLGSQLSTPLGNLTGRYSTMVLMKAACTESFESVMAPLRLDRLEAPPGVQARSRRGRLSLTW